LYIFQNDDQPKVYISSADWMTRNIDHRVEVTCPIYDEDIKQELIETFDICWKDNVKARDFSSTKENAYRKKIGPDFRSQFETYSYYQNKLKTTVKK
jgi:polyphosphate kinase